jgi:hypothetical protein
MLGASRACIPAGCNESAAVHVAVDQHSSIMCYLHWFQHVWMLSKLMQLFGLPVGSWVSARSASAACCMLCIVFPALSCKPARGTETLCLRHPVP